MRIYQCQQQRIKIQKKRSISKFTLIISSRLNISYESSVRLISDIVYLFTVQTNETRCAYSYTIYNSDDIELMSRLIFSFHTFFFSNKNNIYKNGMLVNNIF